ncbi:MAG: glycosyltransferase [Kiritimatiellae bacterium]|nr:glycosyltransferase [Kiritimatiellia bacterium]
MRILLVAPQPFYQERGTPIAVRWVVETLCRAGNRVDLLCFPGGSDVEMERLRIVRCHAPRRLGDIPIGFSWKKLVCDFFLVLRMRSLLRTERYDVVHAVEEAVFPAILLRGRNQKLVYDMDSSMSDQLMEKWPVLRVLAPLFSRFEGWAVRSADLILPVCDYLRQKVDAFHPRGRVCVLHDRAIEDEGGETEVEAIRDLLKVKGVLFLYVGNLEHYQGMALLLAAFAGLSAESPWHLAVIGGRERDVKHYRSEAERLGLENRVTFTGPRPVRRLQQYLAQADVLLSPRIKGGNTPLKIYSYMLAGKAIVATDIPSHKQVLDAECAILAVAEPEAWTAALDDLLRHPEKGALLGEQARLRALKRHTRKAYENTLLSAYSFDMFIDLSEESAE